MTSSFASPDPAQGFASRVRRLKEATHAAHETLDRSIMQAASFVSLLAYGRFVQVQYLFHRDMDALYRDPALQSCLPDLASRRRLPVIAQDLTDLRIDLPDAPAPVFGAGAVDRPTALGWLYVAEGSRLGAALLRKEAARLGLSDGHGARHLAPAAQGPAGHWRTFTMALDAIELDAPEEARVMDGARAAFARVQDHVDARLS